MVIAFVLAIISWLIFKEIWLSLFIFYLVTGIKKSRIWLVIPIRYLPPNLKKQDLTTFLYGIFFWPIILMVNQGDPSKEYFINVDKGIEKLV
ncbi:MAG: hypothetical protein FWD78_03035 [Treponema sp.]|nr:hypothetical protein [Treponema sp.]